LTNYTLKTTVDFSLGLYYLKPAIDSSINSLLGFYTTTTNINNQFNSTDLSINNLRQDINSLVITGSVKDPSINELYLYNDVQDASINALPTKSSVDASLSLYYTKTDADVSINTGFYNKTAIDASINSNFYNKTAIDASINSNFYNKTAIDASINASFYNKTAIDASVNSNFYNKTTIDASINTNFYNKNAIDASLYTKTTIDASVNNILGFYYNKTTIDASINTNFYNKNSIDASLYTKTTIDASVNSILGFYYNKTTIDASINTNFYNKNDIDTSINSNLYNKTTIDASINTNFYNKTAIDASVNSILGFYYNKTAIDASINTSLYNKTAIDASINSNLYNKTTIDASINTNFYNKTAIDASLYTKTAVDASVNSILGFYYTKTATDASINTNFYNKTAIDASLYTKTATDASINSILGFYYNKTATDASINTSFYNKTATDASINSILGFYYNKTATDASINSVLLNYASRLTDVSFAGNIQLGTTRTISVGINKTPSTAYALDISGDLDVNGNVYLGMGANFVGINTIVPGYHLDVSGTLNARSILVNGSAISASIPGYSANTFSFDTSFNGNVQIGSSTSSRSFGINREPSSIYSLDVSGDVRFTETGPGTAASASTGSLVLSHTATGGQSSITFTSPNTGNNDYGYVQYFDNSNPVIATETNGGLMVVGIESKDGSGNINSDRLSLYASNGTGNVGVNTLAPEYNFDVSGTLAYSNVTERLINLGTVGAALTASFGAGLIRYITTMSASYALSFTNIPAIPNRSYVFTFIYSGAATTNYFSSIAALTLASGATGIPTIKGPFTAPASTTCYVQQFYVFITNVTTISSNIVIQTLTTYA